MNMKKSLNMIMAAAIAGAGLCMASCSTQKNAVAELTGEWNITVVGETVVTVPEGEERPFLGFNSATGDLYGNTGCNSLMGSFSENPEKGTLTMSNFATTRMACPDMTLEQTIVETLPKVTSFHATAAGDLELTDNDGLPLITLTPRK